jgi:hypothetical protein
VALAQRAVGRRRDQVRSRQLERVGVDRDLAAVTLEDPDERTRRDDPRVAAQVATSGESPDRGRSPLVIDEHEPADLLVKLLALARARAQPGRRDRDLGRHQRVGVRQGARVTEPARDRQPDVVVQLAEQPRRTGASSRRASHAEPGRLDRILPLLSRDDRGASAAAGRNHRGREGGARFGDRRRFATAAATPRRDDITLDGTQPDTVVRGVPQPSGSAVRRNSAVDNVARS